MKSPPRHSLLPVFALTTLLFSHPCSRAEPVQFKGSQPLQWSVRLADSEIARLSDKLSWREGRSTKWDYTSGLFSSSLLKLNEKIPTPAYVNFTKDTIGSFIGNDGNIHGYKQEEHNLDNLASGTSVLALYELTKEERYKNCADLLRKQLETQPRTSQGGFWHKQRYPYQMWLDGLFMGAPFYAAYSVGFNGPAADLDDVVNQFRLINEHLYDKTSGLYFHGWDEKREQSWADRTTGVSRNFWGRGLGWWAMAQVDVLDFLPKNHPGYAEIVASLKRTCDGIVKHQDPGSGLWWQVLDKSGREGNYLEATASAMFIYSMAKAVNHGYLSRDYIPAIIKGYDGIINRLIKTDERGQVSLIQCCAVAGLGFGRDGSYEYYLSEPIVENDLKGVGPLILAGIELQQLLDLPVDTSHDLKPSDTQPSVAKEWAMLPEILARITPPVIPPRDFSIMDFGAAPDGKSDSSNAISKAINAASSAGGGRIIVPAGEYLTGPIQLKSRIELHLDVGATLKFKTDPNAYLPAVRTFFEGMECYNYSPLIYAYEAENIAVTGEGTLDGQATEGNWWVMKGAMDKSGAPAKTQNAARKRLGEMVADGSSVEERRFGENDYLRPSFIEPFRCRNVFIGEVRIIRSPMWVLHPLLSTNVIVRGVRISSHGPNNDGCDPEACKDVLIEKCVFDTGDDCIAIKSGRNNDGRRLGIPSENIIIRNCTMKDGHGGVTIGSEISGGCRNVFVENCVMDSPDLGRVVRFKSNAMRGGLVENIFVRNVKVGTVQDAVLQIDFVYEEGANGSYKPTVRNVVIENMTVGNAKRVLDIRGFPGSEISGVRIHNSTFNGILQNDIVIEGDVKLIDCISQRKR